MNIEVISGVVIIKMNIEVIFCHYKGAHIAENNLESFALILLMIRLAYIFISI